VTKRLFSTKQKNVTFIGLGNMGYPMAKNLAKDKAYKVFGYDVSAEVQSNFNNEIGNKTIVSLDESLANSDCVLTMLPNSKTVSSNWERCFKLSKKGTFLIDCSTISPVDAKDFSSKAIENGLIPADSPVSGGVNGAINATLTFMVGTEQKHYDTVKSYLQPMGKNIFNCGSNSAGQIAKVCNNLCLGITMAGLSESLALGVKLGIDPKVLSDIMSVSSGRCWSLDSYNPIPNVLPNSPSSRNYEKGFNVELMKKDLNIAKECGKKVDLEMELAELVTKYYETLDGKGLSKKDFSFIYQYILNNKKNI